MKLTSALVKYVLSHVNLFKEEIMKPYKRLSCNILNCLEFVMSTLFYSNIATK